MGRLAIVKDFIRAFRRNTRQTDVKCDTGGRAMVQAHHFGAPGDDGHPMPDDTAALVEIVRSNGFAAVGYLDPKNQQIAQAGERRIYSRGGDGVQVAQVYLKADGTIMMNNGGVTKTLRPDGSERTENSAGFYELGADGIMNINGFRIGTNGTATDSNGNGSTDHRHNQPNDSANDSQQPTGPAVPTQ